MATTCGRAIVAGVVCFVVSLFAAGAQHRIPYEDAVWRLFWILVAMAIVVRTRRIASLVFLTAAIGFYCSSGETWLSVDHSTSPEDRECRRCTRSTRTTRVHENFAALRGVIDYSTHQRTDFYSVRDGVVGACGRYNTVVSPNSYTGTAQRRWTGSIGLCIEKIGNQWDIQPYTGCMSRGSWTSTSDLWWSSLPVRVALVGPLAVDATRIMGLAGDRAPTVGPTMTADAFAKANPVGEFLLYITTHSRPR